MRNHKVFGLASISMLILAGCATFEPGLRHQDLARPRQPDASMVQQGLEVSVEQFADESKAKMAFDANIAHYGILPVLVRIENNGSQNFTVLRSDIRAYWGTQLLSPVMSNEAAKKAGTREYAGKALGWTVATGPFFIFLWPATIGGSAAHTHSVNKRVVQHFESVAFVDARLKPNQTAAGFVYFKLPDNVNKLGQVTVEVQPSEDGSGQRLSYKLNMTNVSIDTGTTASPTVDESESRDGAQEADASGYLKKEPPANWYFLGDVFYVDDGTCPAGMIKQVTEGGVTGPPAGRGRRIPRSRECVPKPTEQEGTGKNTNAQNP